MAPLTKSLAPLRVNGVFKGGGAKGVVYAGALRACAERGIVFVSVAGSSAGAITAALVAAGLEPDEFDVAAAAGIERVRARLFRRFLPVTDKSVFAVDELRVWLEDLLQAKARRESRGDRSPVTFAELYDATGVELNVVVMDLESRQPIVLNHLTAAGCGVSGAVLASCAIPLAMPPGRIVIAHSGETPRVHRVVDGGAWANYPAFVYTSESFRAFYGLPQAAETSVGFVIDPPATEEPPRVLGLAAGRRRFTDLGSGTRAGAVGALLNWPLGRVLAAVVMPVVVLAVMAGWLLSQTGSYFADLAPLPDALESVALIMLAAVYPVVVLATLASAALLWRFGNEAFDVGLPSLLASLSVGPRVPQWVGRAPSEPVVRLSVPEGITTTRFRVPATVRDLAVERAHHEAATQLNTLFPERARPVPPLAPSEQPAAEPPATEPEPARLFLGVYLVFVGSLAFSMAVPSFFADVSDRDWRWAAVWALTLTATIVGGLYVGFRVRQYELVRGRPHKSAVKLAVHALIVGAAFLGLTYLLFGLTGATSRFAASSTLTGSVVDKEGGASNTLYEIRFQEPPSEISQDGDSNAVGRCERQIRNCVTFTSYNNTHSIGDEVIVVVTKDTGEAFIYGDHWRSEGMIGRFAIVGGWAVFALFLSWIAIDVARRLRNETQPTAL